ncbi:MAG: hypothetical protein CMJ75_20090 [Planctomycetaceae bacterium]|nr:hypothetical protein [Planctomycetaceae bacterium]
MATVLRWFLPLAVIQTVVVLVVWATWRPFLLQRSGDGRVDVEPSFRMGETVAKVNRLFATRWAQAGLAPAAPAPQLQILRRLSLALYGTVPALEEIRRFEADRGPDRLARWVEGMLRDRRFSEYFAERLARSYVGVDGGDFVVYRRDRFVEWLTEALAENRRYDEIVREMIADRGLWTGSPSTNFITAALVMGELEEEKLAGRVFRAFLGQRADCAQCHDHPFSDWKQSQFEGVAAFFGQTRLSLGVFDHTEVDGQPVEFEVLDQKSGEQRQVSPQVPFHDEWLPADGTRRARLAAWVTHLEQRRFDRSIVNRVWGLLFGKPYLQPVDDLPDPEALATEDLLDILAVDFRDQGRDLRQLILAMVLSRPFLLDSQHAADQVPVDQGAAAAGDGEADHLLEEWALFPLTRLRPEQVIGAMLQASSVGTIDRRSHLIVRTLRLLRESEFLQEYGDLGEDELEVHPGTIPQALLRMNGELSNSLSQASPFSSAGRVLTVSMDDETLVENCFLLCLTRRPPTALKAVFVEQLRGQNSEQRKETIEDLVWSLFNSEPFAWNH